MKRCLCLLLLCALSTLAYGQNVFKGVVYDKESNKVIPLATVSLGKETKTTQDDGSFEFSNFPAGKISLSVKAQGYKDYTKDLKLTKEGVSQENIYLTVSAAASGSGVTEVSGVSLDFDQDGSNAGSGQSVSSMLSSSEDVFDANSGYVLSALYFRKRGYDNENNSVYINGIEMNDAENGRATYSEWGGLNDAMRNKVSVGGFAPTDFSFGNVGGSVDMNIRASAMRKQQKFSYALSNRTYTQRAMYTFGSGISPKGWAFALSLSGRWAKTGYIPGTPYEAYGYFGAISKKFGQRHELSLSAFGAPTKRGMQGGSFQEVYDLLGTNYYNPNWGMQDGKVRSARIRHMHQPTFFLTWDYTPDEKTKLTTSAAYQFGSYGTTALNWYDAPDPRPDYYRYLPSYYTEQNIKNIVTDMWRNDINTRQIDWDQLYQVNYTQNEIGKQAKYMVEDRRNDIDQFTLSSVLNRELSRNIKLTAGINAKRNVSHNYKLIDDLLGGKYWVDIDQFAERDFSENALEIQNDLNHPNRVVGEGDIFGYDYKMHLYKEQAFAVGNFSYRHIDFYLGADISSTQFWREGFMRNGRAPLNSYGKGETNTFVNYGVKGGITYKINGRNYLYANVLWETRAPYVTDAYLSPRIKDNVAQLTNEKIFSADLNYVIRTPIVNGRITVYQTMFYDGIETTSFYHDQYRTFVNYTKTGVDKVHQGVELGVEVKVIPSLSITGIANFGNYRYTNRPTATVTAENGTPIIPNKYTVYQKNFYVSGTPQNAGSIGINYQAPYYIYLNANVNFFGKMYLSFNPERRTELAVAGLVPDDPLVSEILDQEKLKGGMTIDLSIGKSFRFKGAYFLNLNLGVTNLLNNRNLITGGYEQNRFDFVDHNVGKFPPRYFYAMGTTFFLNIGFRF